MKRMKTKLLILLAIPVIFYGCTKDSYTSAPQISIKSINSSKLSTGDLLLIDINFTDKEGDISDTLWIQKFSRTCPNTAGVQFTSANKVPDFTATSNLKGVLEVGYAYNSNINGYNTISGCGNKNDTAYFKIWLKDLANHVSDTIITSNIILLK